MRHQYESAHTHDIRLELDIAIDDLRSADGASSFALGEVQGLSRALRILQHRDYQVVIDGMRNKLQGKETQSANHSELHSIKDKRKTE